MSVSVAWASDCFQAVNGEPSTPSGGRAFIMASMPMLLQDSYEAYHGATRGAQARGFLLDVLRWLRGGRSTGVVSLSPSNAILGWYSDGEDAPAIGTDARAAIEADGFQTIERAVNTADALFDGADIAIYDYSRYNTSFPVGESAGIWDYVANQNKSILYMGPGNSCGGFGWGNGASYASQVGFYTLYGYAGAEAIFDNTFSGGQTLGVKGYGGRQAQTTGAIGGPADGETYPSTKVASWRNATNAAHWHVLGAFSNHGDIGNVGDTWS